ncbi:sodium transport system permease protein [Natranaerovirga hydrolytica]|uniref:Sodium transport system permease protein n=1 Tax=Natranaerovirga hydrolytica TaxID=680378 RepID=A0A4R1MKL8_9FIRM|nr:ABC transporter permease [Natranaerovirga hydrolytica]TCK93276.1 sodium transport system permease protein [Natranaerovirga hydrolytica]
MLWVIIKKELKRVFSDKRLVFSMFILPAVGIFAMYSFMGVALENMISSMDENVPTVYIQNAPEGFETYTQGEQVNMDIYFIEESTNEIKESIREGDIDLLIEFDSDFMEGIQNYTQREYRPEIKTFYNPSQNNSLSARNRLINNILTVFERDILEQRFGNIEHITAFDIDRTNEEAIIQDDRRATGGELGMLIPVLITIFLFSAVMGIGTDIIAGEKERGTMATLLLSPVKRETIAFGKLISLGMVSILSAICSFAGILASMPFASNMLSGGGDMDMSAFRLEALDYFQLFLIMITMAGIFVGVIALVSVRARSVKEANTYAGPIMMVVMVAAFANMFSQGTPELSSFGIPVYGGVVALKALFEFELTMSQFLLNISSSVAVIVILTVLITRTFNDEKVIFNA